MDIQNVLLLAAWSLSLLVLPAGTLAACRWWYGEKLHAAALRLHKSDKGRLFLQQQAQQARKQVEQLQAELAVRQRAVAESVAAKPKPSPPMPSFQDTAPLPPVATGPMPLPAPHGFADTKVMS